MSKVTVGTYTKLGATPDERGTNFAVFSANAEKIELCLFDDKGEKEIERIALPEKTDEIWHGHIEGIKAGQLYGYRAHGPYDPDNGHRFNHNKLLIDPYAKNLHGEIKWDNALFAYIVGDERKDLSFDERDSAPFMPKCIVENSLEKRNGKRPKHSWSDTIIYEAHVKGFTKLHPGVPEKVRGTFAGLGEPAAIEHLTNLGITAIELLPVHSFVNDSFLLEKNMVNYWGYNTINFFAPDQRYLATGQLEEMRSTIDKLHAAGIEVILDVVFNHTAEGNHMGPTLSFKGLDNYSYYRLSPEDLNFYFETTGCGNNLDLRHPRVLQMVMDSLRYWATELQIDGFRFDLASALGRESPDFDQNSGFFRAVRQDPVLANIKMIAEPWDIGPTGYQVGGFPPGWSEWNGRYRDTIRSFMKGDEGKLAKFAARISGSADIFNHRGRRPWSSINFITAHDGFTLMDLVSYNGPHNEANQEQSGHDDNKSWNCGAEGPTDDENVIKLRYKQIYNFLTALLFSQGVPMMLAGDEIGHSQSGNNNAYCQDNEITWLDWNLNDKNRELLRFTKKLISIRKKYHAFRHTHFLSGEPEGGRALPDVSWMSPSGNTMHQDNWEAGFAKTLGIHFSDEKNHLFLLFNAHGDEVPFVLPGGEYGSGWSCIIDTDAKDNRSNTPLKAGETYHLKGHSVAFLASEVKQ